MSNEPTVLEALDNIKFYSHLVACSRCQYYKNGKCENNIGDCLWKDEINIIEKSLKALEIIKKQVVEIAEENPIEKPLSDVLVIKFKKLSSPEEEKILEEVLL